MEALQINEVVLVAGIPCSEIGEGPKYELQDIMLARVSSLLHAASTDAEI